MISCCPRMHKCALIGSTSVTRYNSLELTLVLTLCQISSFKLVWITLCFYYFIIYPPPHEIDVGDC